MFASAQSSRPETTPTRRPAIIAVSTTLHALLVAALLYHHPIHVEPMRLPGDAHGSHLVLTYLPGRAASSAVAPAPKVIARLTRPRLSFQAPVAPVAGRAAEPSPQPDSSQGNDGLGQGDITIALMQFFPDPKPDLAQLPAGTRGDVVLYAVIGADGRIEHLTLTQGLGHGIDESVIATVQQWTFHPALRNGKPVPSEQEFHFHYERG